MRKSLASISLFILLTLSLPFSVLATDGAGDGSGGGSNQPLVLESSTVPDGSKGVALDVKITLLFNKNVVNMAVRDNNLTCFSLADSKGAAVGIDVIMGDDQIDPTIKNTVEIRPKAALSPDTGYKLTISGNLTSKSGVSLGQAVTLTFTTLGAPGAVAPSAATPSGDPSTSVQPSVKPSPAPTPVSPSPGKASAEPSAEVTAQSTAVASNAVASNAVASNAVASNGVQETDNSNDTQSAENQPKSLVPYIIAGAVVIAIAGAVTALIRRKK